MSDSDSARERTELADRRTGLAVERTRLAWWRTGLTSLAVAIGVGRVVPELSASDTTWPYGLVGIAFAIYGIALFVLGNTRRGPRLPTQGPQTLPQSVGSVPEPAVTRTDRLLALAGVGLGLLVVLVIVLA